MRSEMIGIDESASAELAAVAGRVKIRRVSCLLPQVPTWLAATFVPQALDVLLR